MRIKQIKVAQPLRGAASNILESKNYDMRMDGEFIHVTLKHNPSNIGPFIIFKTNVAYMELEKEEKTVEVKTKAK